MHSNEIKELSEKYSTLTAENLSALVKIKSLSGEEKEVAHEVRRQMLESGFDDVRFDGLGNVIGRIGSGKRILAIDGHVDTVDVGNLANWDFDPFCGEIRDGYVYGRGSVDQKGGVAAFITAGKIIKELGLADNITVLFVGSVIEEDCDGLCWKYLVEEEGIRPDVVISTEPTNLNIYRGQRGRMEMDVEFNGISSHGSAPERGKNAIYMASRACLAIEKLNNNLKNDDFLGKGSITISQFVSGAPSLCAVADYAKIHLDRRLTWGETKISAIAEIEKIVEGLDAKVTLPYYKQKGWTGKEYGMEQYYPTWMLSEDHPAIQTAVKTFEELFNKKPLVDKWTFSTNGVTINGIYGIPVLGFGPGNEVMAHAPNEKTPVSDLVAASAFYAGFTNYFNAYPD
ncbi:MAG TPA: YgeY family selenium metabolism-linked hydrolase [Bacteroidales bacterium]|nr:YgeY family selenium metabolism-linked hydrolase [Bacteroidales bacterium]HRW96908.1 YgeY family selenium metabolism-linked hydrolase [Bacteroidales bacterium]